MMMPNGRDRRFIGEDGYAGSDGDFPAEQPNYDILKACGSIRPRTR